MAFGREGFGGSTLLPLGPYREYEQYGEIPEPEDPQVLIDPRTGVPYGNFSEDEIDESLAESISVATLARRKEQEITQVEKPIANKLEMNPEANQIKRDIFSISTNLFKIGRRQGRINELRYNYLQSGETPEERDKSFLTEIEPIQQEIQKLASELPDNYEGHSWPHRIVRDTMSFGGQMANMAGAAAKEFTGFDPDKPFYGAIQAPSISRAIPGGQLSFMLQYPVQQSTGEIFGSLQQAEIDEDIASEIATQMGIVGGSADMAGLVSLAFGGGAAGAASKTVISRFMDFATGVVGEAGTEGFQSLVEDVALFRASKAQAERNGEVFDKDVFDFIDVEKARESAKSGFYGGIGMAGLAAGTRAGVEAVGRKIASPEAAHIMNERGRQEETDAAIQRETEQLQAEKIQKQQDKAKPTSPLVDPETGQQQDFAPASNLETRTAFASPRVDGTNINDNTLDDFAIADEETAEAMVDEIISGTVESVGENSVRFSLGLREVLPEEQASAIESLIDSRASAIGITREEFITNRGIEFERVADEPMEAPSAQLIIEEGRMIVQAFSGADVSSVAHEIGHIFRRDIPEADQRILDEWVGLEPGTQWDVRAEEQFARAWEGYLRDGQAPTTQLQSIFEKFNRWMTEIYKTIRNSPIDVQMTPEVRAVMDRMFMARLDGQAQMAQTQHQQQRMILEQRQPTTEQLRKLQDDVRRVSREQEAKQEEALKYGEARLTGDITERSRLNAKIRQLEGRESTLKDQLKDARRQRKNALARRKRRKERTAEWREQNNAVKDQERRIKEIQKEIQGLPKQLEQAQAERDSYRDAEGRYVHGVYEDFVATRRELLGQRKVMQEMMAVGDSLGYARARADMKVMFERAKNRTAAYKLHSAYKRRYFKALDDALKPGARFARERMTPETREVIKDLKKRLTEKIVVKEHKTLRDGTTRVTEKTYDGAKQIAGAVHMYDMHVLGDSRDASQLSRSENLMMMFLDAARDRSPNGAQKMKAVYEDILAEISGGTTGTPIMLQRQQARNIVNVAVPEITGTTVREVNERTAQADPQALYEQSRKSKTLRERIATSTIGKDLIFGWNGLLDMVSAYSQQGFGNSDLRKALDIFDENQAKQTDIREAKQWLSDMYMRAYGLRSRFNTNEKMLADTREQITLVEGQPQINRNQLRQYWMLLKTVQDGQASADLDHQTAAQNMSDRLKNRHGLTDEVRIRIDQIMTDQDKAFAQAQLDRYQGDLEYGRNNEAHNRIYGIDLPFIAHYMPLRSEKTPTRRRGEEGVMDMDDPGTPQWKQDVLLRKTPETSRHLKKRSKDVVDSRLIIEGDIGLFNSYQEEMAHFRHFTEKIQLAKLVIESDTFKNAVISEYGQDTYRALVNSWQRNAADGMANAGSIKFVDKFRNAFIVSQIGLSVSVTLKQLISIQNFAQDMPPSELISGLVAFWKDPAKHRAEMRQHQFFANRDNSLDRDFADLMNSKQYKAWLSNPTLKNMLTKNVRVGDQAAIVWGGWSYVRYLKKQVNPETGQNYTQQEALDVMVRKAEETQQSGATHQLSEFQSGGSWARLFTMFSTGPVQATRQIVEAQRGLAAGRIDMAQYAKTMAIYYVMVPLSFSVASSFLSREDWEGGLKNAGISVLLGPLGATYSVGNLLVNTARHAFNMRKYPNAGPFSDTLGYMSKFLNRLFSPVTGAEEGITDLTDQDWVNLLQAGLNLNGMGIPARRAYRIVAGLHDLAEDVQEGAGAAEVGTEAIRAVSGVKPREDTTMISNRLKAMSGE